MPVVHVHVQAFSSWVHLIAIRLFVESILRYGLPPAYQAAVMVPADKSEARLRQVLSTTFAGGERSNSGRVQGEALLVGWRRSKGFALLDKKPQRGCCLLGGYPAAPVP